MTAGGFLRVGERVQIASGGASGGVTLMRNISAWAIRHPVPPVVLFVVLTVHGHRGLHPPARSSSNPDISFPIVTSPSRSRARRRTEMETQILQKVEGAVAGIGNIRNITSWATEGQAEHLHRVPDRHAHRSGGHRRARRRRQGALGSAAGHPGAARAARQTPTATHRLLRGQHHSADASRSCPGSSTTRSPSACWPSRASRR